MGVTGWGLGVVLEFHGLRLLCEVQEVNSNNTSHLALENTKLDFRL
jgi:hypothetical protein